MECFRGLEGKAALLQLLSIDTRKGLCVKHPLDECFKGAATRGLQLWFTSFSLPPREGHRLNLYYGFLEFGIRKRGLLEKGLFRKVPCSRGSRDF